MGNGEKRKIVYAIGKAVFIVGFLSCLSGTYFAGTRENWYGFGLAILGCVFNVMLFVAVVLSHRVDIAAESIKELIREKQGRQGKESSS